MTTRREKSKPQKPQNDIQQQEVKVERRERRPEIKKVRREQRPKEDQSIALDAGRFCLDIAKLVFGGVILAGIMQQGIEFNSLFITGLGVVLLFVVFGFYLIKKSKR